MKRDVFTLVFMLVILSALPAIDVDEIVRRAEESFTATRIYSVNDMTRFEDSRVDLSTTIESYTMNSNGASRSLIIYTEPVRMRGTAYLMIGDDVWVRFGSTGRVRKLSSSAKSGSAGGTDFSYADLGEGDGGISESYDTRLLPDRSRIDGIDCYKIEFTPRSGADSGYDRLVAYISHDSLQYVAIDYYQSGAHTKTLTLSDYRTVGRIEYPFKLSMRTITTNTRTDIIVVETEFDSDAVRESMFTVQYLERLR